MASLQTRIVFLCLLTVFASTAFAQNFSPKQVCDATMREAKQWLAAFNPTAPNAEQTFQEKNSGSINGLNTARNGQLAGLYPLHLSFLKNPPPPSHSRTTLQ
jgi:hypothetical protein